MTQAAVQTEKLTLDAFIRLYESEGPFEIIEGERIALMPPVYIHVLIIKRLMAIFLEYENTHHHGEAFQEAPFVMTDKPGWVAGSRVPDVMYFSAERLKTYREQTPNYLNKPFILVPDLAVEVISQNDLYSEVQRKVDTYRHDGVRLVWVIDPERRVVIVQHGTTQITLGEEETLSGGEVIPDLAIPVGRLFEEG